MLVHESEMKEGKFKDGAVSYTYLMNVFQLLSDSCGYNFMPPSLKPSLDLLVSKSEHIALTRTVVLFSFKVANQKHKYLIAGISHTHTHTFPVL